MEISPYANEFKQEWTLNTQHFSRVRPQQMLIYNLRVV